MAADQPPGSLPDFPFGDVSAPGVPENLPPGMLEILMEEASFEEMGALYDDYDTGSTVPVLVRTPDDPDAPAGDAIIAALLQGFQPGMDELQMEDAALAELEGLYDDYDTGR